jgi:hypothetical protein
MKAVKKNKKDRPIGERNNSIDFSPPYEGSIGRSVDRQIADKIYNHHVTPEERRLGSYLSQEPGGHYVRRTNPDPALSSPAFYNRGGLLKKKESFTVESDGQEYTVEGKLITRGNREVFKAKGKGSDSGPIKSIREVTVRDKNSPGLVVKHKKNVKFKRKES